MFTPGPWIYEETDDGHMILMGNAIKNRGCYDAHCQIEYNHMCFYDEGLEDDSPANAQAREAEANAQLIAAAPAMYEALKEAVALLNHMYAEAMAYKPDRDKIEALAWNGLSGNSQIKQALAKAEGRA
jgi:hypothetical protein